MPDANIIKELAVLMRDQGGWPMAVLLMYALYHLHKSMSALLEKRNGELLLLLSEHKSELGENRIVIDRVESVMGKVEVALNENKRAIDQIETKTEKTESSLVENSKVLERVKIYLEDMRR